MCEPTTLLYMTLALSAAEAAAQKRQQDVQYSRSTSAAKTADDREQAALVRQRDQQHASDTQAVNDAAKQSLHDMALFDTVAGEYGGGVTDQRAAGILTVQNGEKLSTLAENGMNAQSELGFQGLDAHQQALARIGSVSPGSLLGMGLQIAGSAAGAYSRARSPSTAPTSTPTSVRASGSDLYGYKGAGGF